MSDETPDENENNTNMHFRQDEIDMNVSMDQHLTIVVVNYTQMNRCLTAIDNMHRRLEAPAGMDHSVEMRLISCSCTPSNQWIWKDGDNEPAWKCPTRKILDGEF